jgi:predicted GNAT superfamily acetyltransferase
VPSDRPGSDGALAGHTVHLRDATAADFPRILELNEESVHHLSPLTREGLQWLHDTAAYHRVVVDDGEVVAFLLALREGGEYESLNYRWFARTYDRFLYVDRVVVANRSRGAGVGRRLYADLLLFARQTGAERVTCEFDTDPPNEPSRRFHESQGFREVGTQAVAGGRKTVSLQAVLVPPEAGT